VSAHSSTAPDTALLLEQALAYAARGWRILPCHSIKDGACTCKTEGTCTSPGKHPRTEHGLKDATTDGDTIKRWWTRWPGANIGILTGSASGFFVLDVDPPHGGDESLSALEAEHGKLPDTAEVKTGGGGRHLLFLDAGTGLRNTAGFKPGLDIRGAGGYIVAAPSNHISGGSYQWLRPPDNNGAIMPAPDWLLKLLAAPKAKKATKRPVKGKATVTEGSRNTVLARLAGSLRREGASEAELLTELRAANQKRCSPPLDDDEVRRIAASIAQYAPGGGFFDGKVFIPLRLAKRLQKDAVFAFGVDSRTGTGRLMRYSAGVWLPDAKRVEIEIKNLLVEAHRRNRLEETVHVLERDVERRRWSEWNKWSPDKPLINCTNGMLDVMTGELKPHSPDYYSMFRIPHVWDPHAADERLMECLTRLLPADGGRTPDVLFEMLGYFLVPCQAAKRFFVLVGPGDSGKNVVQNLARNLVGAENCAQTSWQALCENRFAAARLEGKLLNVPDELASKGLRDVEHLKMLTGGNMTFEVERKGVDAYEAPLACRSLFTCNELPTGAGEDDEAYYNRLVPFPFTKSIPPKEQDVWYRDVMPGDRKVLQALLVFAVHGLQRLIQRKWQFKLSEECKEAVGAYREVNDTIGAFVRSCCQVHPDARARRTEIYAAFERFCKEMKRGVPSRQHFYERLRKMGAQTVTIKGVDWLRGIGLSA